MMGGERPDVTEAALAGLRAASTHVLRAGYELVTAAMAFVDELGEAFRDDEDDEPEDDSDGGRQHIPVD